MHAEIERLLSELKEVKKALGKEQYDHNHMIGQWFRTNQENVELRATAEEQTNIIKVLRSELAESKQARKALTENVAELEQQQADMQTQIAKPHQ